MATTVNLCDRCHNPISGHFAAGVIVNVDISRGSLLNRKDRVQWSGRVCHACDVEFESMRSSVNFWIRNGQRPNAAPAPCHPEPTVTVDTKGLLPPPA
jgi:hypothetical protein